MARATLILGWVEATLLRSELYVHGIMSAMT
jgi:hypothetical protein